MSTERKYQRQLILYFFSFLPYVQFLNNTTPFHVAKLERNGQQWKSQALGEEH